jgi:hypothetical protein
MRYSPSEDTYLKDHYLMQSAKEISQNINRSTTSIYSRLRRLGLVLPEDIKHEHLLIGLRKGWESGNKGSFKKGNIPANKGKKMTPDQYQKAAPTMFKKGAIPLNSKYDGAISLRCDKRTPNNPRPYYYIRLAPKKWKELHLFLWEKSFGPLTKGQVVRFKDGNSLNCVIENLELLDRKGNMIRNSIQRYPIEVKQAIFALAKLKKTINNHGKK